MSTLQSLLAGIGEKIRNRKLFVAIAAIILIAAAGLFFVLNKEARSAPEPETITYSTDEPDESKENADNYNWRGNPNDPKKIRIPKINVDTYIQRAGVDQHNRVAVPNNIHLASWFADSQQPGQNGLSIISAHVTGRSADGVFKQLGALQDGDEFEIELGDGSTKRYKVIGKTQVKEADSVNYLFSQNPKVKSQVNLITCGGTFDKASNQYEDRIIVSGELIP